MRRNISTGSNGIIKLHVKKIKCRFFKINQRLIDQADERRVGFKAKGKKK